MQDQFACFLDDILKELGEFGYDLYDPDKALELFSKALNCSINDILISFDKDYTKFEKKIRDLLHKDNNLLVTLLKENVIDITRTY